MSILELGTIFNLAAYRKRLCDFMVDEYNQKEALLVSQGKYTQEESDKRIEKHTEDVDFFRRPNEWLREEHFHPWTRMTGINV